MYELTNPAERVAYKFSIMEYSNEIGVPVDVILAKDKHDVVLHMFDLVKDDVIKADNLMNYISVHFDVIHNFEEERKICKKIFDTYDLYGEFFENIEKYREIPFAIYIMRLTMSVFRKNFAKNLLWINFADRINNLIFDVDEE